MCAYECMRELKMCQGPINIRIQVFNGHQRGKEIISVLILY